MLIKDHAICIRAIDYSETSQIITLFAKDTGKFDAIAKGSKRPKSAFDGPIEIFSYGNVVFSTSKSKKLATLTEFKQNPTFSHLISNLFALNCSLFAAELLNSFTEQYDPHPNLYEHLIQFIQNLKQTDQKVDSLKFMILFQIILLKETGMLPVLSHCINCRTRYEQKATKNEIYFSSSANGLICRDCEQNFSEKIRLSKNAANCLVNLNLIKDANEKTINEIEKILIYHFTQMLHKPPKMAKHILQ